MSPGGGHAIAALMAMAMAMAMAPAGCEARTETSAGSEVAAATSPAQTASPATVTKAGRAANMPSGADATSAIAPGAYATEQGWGQLSIRQADDGATFALDTENSGAGCSLSGKVSGLQATAYDGTTASACVLDFTVKADALSVASRTTEACRAYCGSNGSYEGDYLKLVPHCAPDAVRKTRVDFKAQYDRKAYADAAATLAPVYRECLPTLALADEGGVRNDYALTQHKLGDDAACLAALGKYGDESDRTDDEITDGMAPAIVDDYLAVVDAARTNARLCGRKAKR